MARSDEGQLPERVRGLAAPIAAELGAEVLDVVVSGQRGRRAVRVVADAAATDASAGLDIDTIADLSRRLGDALDDEDLIAGAYTLEVTSPGADRPLAGPRDFARNTGREVRVVHTDPDVPDVTGTIRHVSDEAVTLVVDGSDVTVPLADVDHGKVVLPW